MYFWMDKQNSFQVKLKAVSNNQLHEETSLPVICLSRHSQNPKSATWQHEILELSYTCNLPNYHRFFMIQGLSMYDNERLRIKTLVQKIYRNCVHFCAHLLTISFIFSNMGKPTFRKNQRLFGSFVSVTGFVLFFMLVYFEIISNFWQIYVTTLYSAFFALIGLLLDLIFQIMKDDRRAAFVVVSSSRGWPMQWVLWLKLKNSKIVIV